MRRTARALGVLFVLCAIAYGWWVFSRRERYSMASDLGAGVSYVKMIFAAERECYEKHKFYASANELGPGGCGGLQVPVGNGEYDGFAAKVYANDQSLAIQLTPSSKARFLSLYCDQTGVIHIGTRDRPATRDSLTISARP